MTGMWLLAQDEAPEPDQVTAGWTGLIVLLLLALATAFLVRSMNRRLKGIDFDEDEPGGRDDAEDDPGRDPDDGSVAR